MNEPPSDLPARLLSAFFRLSRTPWHRAPADGLSQSETDILENIRRANRHDKILRVADVSTILRVSSSTITQHLNHLEDHGFIERTRLKEDKRAVSLTLTDKGNEALRSHRTKLEADFAAFIETIGEQDAEKMIEIITQARQFFTQRAEEYDNQNFFERG